MIYHTALKKFHIIDVGEEQYYEDDKVTAFVHNIEINGLHDKHLDCDFIYAEIPWKDGYDVFNERVGFEGKGYDHFIRSVLKAVSVYNKPIILTGGKYMKKYMPSNCEVIESHFSEHNIDVLLFCFNLDRSGLDFSSTHKLMDSLFKKYDKGGDFCCGYGNLGVFAGINNKKVVLSDINAKCIGYIKDKAGSWYENI